MTEMMCEKMECNDKMMLKWCCVVGMCKKCGRKKLKQHNIEKSNDAEDTINFKHNVQFTRCSKHGLLGRGKLKACTVCEDENKKNNATKGKLSAKKEQIRDKMEIGNFMENVYMPWLESCD